MVFSDESFSYPDDSGLELGLGLSLGIGSCGKDRILAAKELSLVIISDDKDSSSSSSSSSVTRANNNNYINNSCGLKRSADEPVSPPGRSSVSQVVGWPPVKTYRMNSLVNNAKLPATQDFVSTDDKSKSQNQIQNDRKKISSYVKVNMDGIPIGRKVDLAAHSCYETLAHALDNMFRPSAAISIRGTNIEEHVIVAGMRQPIRLLDGLSEFVLTYEDMEGDLMLVGDVPWEMFLSSVRRLRIMRTAEANGISMIP